MVWRWPIIHFGFPELTARYTYKLMATKMTGSIGQRPGSRMSVYWVFLQSAYKSKISSCRYRWRKNSCVATYWIERRNYDKKRAIDRGLWNQSLIFVVSVPFGPNFSRVIFETLFSRDTISGPTQVYPRTPFYGSVVEVTDVLGIAL